MAKQLRKQSRNRRGAEFDLDPPPQDRNHAKEATGETPDIKREFILTASADETLHQGVRIFSRATGTDLTNSHFLRVLLKTVEHALPELEKEASRIGRLKRPSNAKGHEADREEYERRLAQALLVAIRKCGQM
jgi:hypothetical protein